VLNPFKLLAIYNDLNKIEAVAKEKATVKLKVTQILTLLISLFGTVGVPALATNWLHAHVGIYAGFVAAAILLHAIFPSIFSAPSAQDTQATGMNKVGIILLMMGFGLASVGSVKAQTATPASNGVVNLYGAGMSYSVNASPAVAGTALYAHQVNNSGTYAFTAVDALPATLKPFTVTSNVGIGVAQKITTLGKVTIFMPTSAGISWSGTNTGWQWNGGAVAVIPLKSNYYIMPTVRFLKSSVSSGSGYQPIIGLLFGWGK
jgi:hypothetical protein